MPFTRITIDPHQMGGAPCICHLQVPVAIVVDMVAEGIGVSEILASYPDLEAADAKEALQYAAQAVRERELPLVAASFSGRSCALASTDQRWIATVYANHKPGTLRES